MGKKDYKFSIGLVVFIHSIIVITSGIAMVLLFYEDLKIHAAIWLVGLGLVEFIYGYCPLTTKEYDLRKKSGERVKKTKFVPLFFKKYLHLNISEGLADIFLNVYYLLALIVLLDYLI